MPFCPAREIERAAKESGKSSEEVRAIETRRKGLEKRRDKALALA